MISGRSEKSPSSAKRTSRHSSSTPRNTIRCPDGNSSATSTFSSRYTARAADTLPTSAAPRCNAGRSHGRTPPASSPSSRRRTAPAIALLTTPLWHRAGGVPRPFIPRRDSLTSGARSTRITRVRWRRRSTARCGWAGMGSAPPLRPTSSPSTQGSSRGRPRCPRRRRCPSDPPP